MGTWIIEIEGHGPHDNGIPEDADQIAADTVERLKDAGHTVDAARFTTAMIPRKNVLDTVAARKLS